MKAHDEIKKGLEVCNIWMVDEPNRCMECPYFCTKDCADTLMKHALALIQQLEAERDAMKEALGLMVYQYCVSGTKLDHHYMCAGETAFRVLGLEQRGDTRSLEAWLFPEYQEEDSDA